MIDIKALERSEPEAGTQKTYLEEYRETLKNRGMDPSDLEGVLEQNRVRKALITEKETLRAQQNTVGEQVVQKKKAKEDAGPILAEMQILSAKIKALDLKVTEIETDLEQKLLQFPNKLHASVPVGQSEADNQLVRKVGEPKSFSFKPKEHSDLGEALQILDFERAGKVAGARFAFLRGAASRMERALIQFMLDTHADRHGYEEIIPPFIVNSRSMTGTGQFPKFTDDVFHLTNTDYHLIPTSEVPVTNFFSDETLNEDMLPKAFCAYSPCFRSEAGSYGRDTKGLIRQHQFNKVEMLMFSHPDNSYEQHEKMVSHAEKILQLLELPYRVMSLCSRDIGFGAAKCYDLEVWLPGQNAYREISSCSNFEDFQARRANIRFKTVGPKAKPRFVHTLNGSGLAVGRTLIAILENYQQEDGSILLPNILQSYMGGLKKIERPRS